MFLHMCLESRLCTTLLQSIGQQPSHTKQLLYTSPCTLCHRSFTRTLPSCGPLLIGMPVHLPLSDICMHMNNVARTWFPSLSTFSTDKIHHSSIW
jgi:hypothetical protein